MLTFATLILTLVCHPLYNEGVVSTMNATSIQLAKGNRLIEVSPERLAIFKMRIAPPDQNGCTVWTRGRDRAGYGSFSVGKAVVFTHRLAWMIANGPIPEGMMICHKCDNPPCCNPDHLFLGTHDDNTDDKVAKGRQIRGSDIGNSLLTEEQVLEIRRIYGCGEMGQVALGKKFGVTQANINDIVLRHTWTHLPDDGSYAANLGGKITKKDAAKGESHPQAKLTAEDVIQIRKLYAEGGISQPKLAAQFQIHQAGISRILLRKTWTHV